MRSSRRVLALTTAAVAAVAVSSGAAVAASHSTPTYVDACVSSAHVLSLLQHGRCPAGTTEISLSHQGPRGLTGARGGTGKVGATGKTGATGATGAAGAVGAAGPQGLPGANGNPGTNGVNGMNGTDGVNGISTAVGTPAAGGPDHQFGTADGAVTLPAGSYEISWSGNVRIDKTGPASTSSEQEYVTCHLESANGLPADDDGRLGPATIDTVDVADLGAFGESDSYTGIVSVASSTLQKLTASTGVSIVCDESLDGKGISGLSQAVVTPTNFVINAVAVNSIS